MIFDPKHWYWFVAGDETRVFSSRAGDYVQLTNPAYVAWRADGGVPTRIVSEAELGEVLSPHRVRPNDAAVLEAYLDTQAGEVIDAFQFKILFQHENRLRALERWAGLDNKPNLTPAQARAAVKVML